MKHTWTASTILINSVIWSHRKTLTDRPVRLCRHKYPSILLRYSWLRYRHVPSHGEGRYPACTRAHAPDVARPPAVYCLRFIHWTYFDAEHVLLRVIREIIYLRQINVFYRLKGRQKPSTPAPAGRSVGVVSVLHARLRITEFSQGAELRGRLAQ